MRMVELRQFFLVKLRAILDRRKAIHQDITVCPCCSMPRSTLYPNCEPYLPSPRGSCVCQRQLRLQCWAVAGYQPSH